MTNNIYTLLLMSASGTIMYILSCVFGKRAKHHVWRYAMLITTVLMLLVPIQEILDIPRLFTVTVPQTVSVGTAADGAGNAASAGFFTPETLIVSVWLAGVITSAAIAVIRYLKTARLLKNLTEECQNEKVLASYRRCRMGLSVKRRIAVRESKYLYSPLLFGLFKPMLILPRRDFSDKELDMIFTHELTHYRHRDLWIALAASAAQCVHWFNPAVYLMEKSIGEVCELFCDETVVRLIPTEDKKSYGKLILSVIETGASARLAFTTSMAASGGIKQRLKKIMDFRMPTRASAIAGFMLVCACMVSSFTVLGFETASAIIPEEIKSIVPPVLSNGAATASPTAASTPTPTAQETADYAYYSGTDSAEAYDTGIHDTDIYNAATDTAVSENAEQAAVPDTAYISSDNAEIAPNDEYTEPQTDDTAAAAESGTAETQTDDTAADVFGEDSDSTSYVFNAEFDGSGESQSGSFSVNGDSMLHVRKNYSSQDIPVSVHNAETGEVIYDERETRTHEEFFMSVPEDAEYYVTAYSEDGNGAGIYIYSE